MDSLNLLFGLNTKMTGASEKPVSETAIVYTTRFDTTYAGTGLIQELLMDDGKKRNNVNDQKSDDLSCNDRNIKEFSL